MITVEDVSIINKVLAAGADVKIKNTANGGYQILSEKATVIKKVIPDESKKVFQKI